MNVAEEIYTREKKEWYGIIKKYEWEYCQTETSTLKSRLSAPGSSGSTDAITFSTSTS